MVFTALLHLIAPYVAAGGTLLFLIWITSKMSKDELTTKSDKPD